MPAFSTSSFVRLAAIVASAIAILAPLPASTQGNRAVASDRNIIETLAESGRFSTLLAAIEAAGLSSTLEKIESATLFAPSDRAFRRLPKGQLETLIAEPDALASLLSYHIVPGTLRSSALKNGALATLLENTPLEISVTRYWEHYISIDIDGTSVRKKDIPASNGLIHEIGSVLARIVNRLT